MPSETFDHLQPAKKETVTRALLEEFSAHPLAQAQVARIVKAAGISRGAFYTYFNDLQDAYTYLYALALKEVHSPTIVGEDASGGVSRSSSGATCQRRVDAIVAFVLSVRSSKYYRLLANHIVNNESCVDTAPLMRVGAWSAGRGDATQGALGSAGSKPGAQDLNPVQWAVMTLAHEAIKEALAPDAPLRDIAGRLSVALRALVGENGRGV